MPEQFVALGDNGKAWRLGSSVSERDMKHDAGTAEPYCPALIPVGNTSSGQLLLDFEQIGAASVTGPAQDRDGFLREIVLGAMAAPWTKDCEIVVIGVPDINPMPGSRLVSPVDPVAWAQKIAKSVARDAKDMTSSPYEGRVEGVVESHPTIVVVGSEFAAVAQHLAGAAMLARSSLTLIAGSELTSEARIVLTGTKATLEPSGLRWDLRTVNEIDVKMVDGLMTDAETQQAEPRVEPVVSVTQPEQLVTSPMMLDLIESIMAPCGVEVKTLRSEPVVEGVKMQAKLGAVTTYIALNPGVSAKKVKAMFWPQDTTRAAENAFGKIRGILGETEDGVLRFAKGTEFKFRDVGSDWQRFNALVEAANSTSVVVDQAAALDVALRLVSGEPAKDVRGVLWSWFIDDRARYETMSALIVDAAVMRARLALEAEDALAARMAVRSGERAVPDSEALKQVSLQATKALEGNEKLDDEYRAALADAEERGYDLSSGTHRLYNILRAQPDLRSVRTGTIVLTEATAV